MLDCTNACFAFNARLLKVCHFPKWWHWVTHFKPFQLCLCAQVKDYVQRQWTKILAGRVSLADFVFAKEVRLGTYSARHGIIPPAAIVASRAMASDPRMEPRYGERVPFVVVYGEPGGWVDALQ